MLLNAAQILYLHLTFSPCPECLSTACGRRDPFSARHFQIKRGPGKERSIQSGNFDPHPKKGHLKTHIQAGRVGGCDEFGAMILLRDVLITVLEFAVYTYN